MVQESQAKVNCRNPVFLGMPAVIASEPMLRLMGTIERVARSTATVLITGESGSGKEIVARAVHHYSMRSQRPWVDLSCAALPEHLLESELFGYDKGAFSGADSHKPGLFEMANQGTIFLDEIGELDLKMQVKLLRVLDGVAYYRLGGVKKVSVDVRVVAATNQNLEEAAAEGRFRSDLYHRLSQITLHVPPLRHRIEDIAPLASYFLAQHDPQSASPQSASPQSASRLSFSRSALELLMAHTWPGNIRELRNVVTKAAVLARGPVIHAEDLPSLHSPFSADPIRRPAQAAHPLTNHSTSHAASNGTGPHMSRDASLDEIERRTILEALAATGGHQQRAAARLGISRRTLSRKLKLYESERTEAAS
jgi:two-component system, NtrC family, response regulator AtoC